MCCVCNNVQNELPLDGAKLCGGLHVMSFVLMAGAAAAMCYDHHLTLRSSQSGYMMGQMQIHLSRARCSKLGRQCPSVMQAVHLQSVYAQNTKSFFFCWNMKCMPELQDSIAQLLGASHTMIHFWMVDMSNNCLDCLICFSVFQSLQCLSH